MSITPPTGILDITDAIVRVSKLEFRGATGFDTILNNVARNTILLVDQNVEYTTDTPWGLKLPNAWVSEFDAYWASGASGNITFNVYNNTTSGTNGYTIAMDDTTITIAYDGGSALKTVTLGSTLKNDTWRKIHILFERDMLSLAIDGVPVLYFKDTLLRPRVYDEESGYVIASGLGANRKFKNLRMLNGDKWMTDTTSNIAYVHGNVGIGTTQAAYTLDVVGDIHATGNLLIEGLTTTVDTQNLSIEDAIVEIGRGNDGGTSGKDVGFLFTRNDGTNTTNSNVALIYDESTDRLTLGYSDGSPTDSTLAINTSKSLDVVIPSGNLGVGTASPTNILHLYKTTTPTLYMETPTTGRSAYTIYTNSADSNTAYCGIDGNGLFDHSSGALALGTNSTTPIIFSPNYTTGEKMRITSAGNVGIGTASPDNKLEIADHASRNPTLLKLTCQTPLGGTGSESNTAIQLLGTDGTTYGGYIEGYLSQNVGSGLKLGQIGGSGEKIEHMRITGGNVGIGTASPGYKLDVYGDANGIDLGPIAAMGFSDLGVSFCGIKVGQKVSVPYSRTALSVEDSGVSILHANGQNKYVGIGTASPQDNLHIYADESGGTQLKIENQYDTGDSRAGLFLQTRSSNVFSLQYTPATESVIFDNAGMGGYAFYQKNAAGTTNHVVGIDKDGNVGIGTASPAYKLHIRSGTASALLLESDNGGTGYPVNIDFRNYNAQEPPGARISVTDDTDYGSDIRFLTKTGSGGTGALSERMIIQGDGNVGIGTASPQAKLQVAGTMLSTLNASVANYSYYDNLGSDAAWRTAFTIGTTAIGLFSVLSYNAGYGQSWALWMYQYKAGGTSGDVIQINGSTYPTFRLQGQTVEHNGGGGQKFTELRVFPFII